MILRVEELGDFCCPSCGISLEVENNYEDRKSDCSGKAHCPECNKKLYIKTRLEFIPEVMSESS